MHDENFTKFVLLTRYRDSVDNTPASSAESDCGGCCQQGHVGSKTLHHQNPLVFNWRYRLMQIDPYNGCETMVVLLVVLFWYDRSRESNNKSSSSKSVDGAVGACEMWRHCAWCLVIVNPRSGLLQSSVITAYTMYLTWSAMTNNQSEFLLSSASAVLCIYLWFYVSEYVSSYLLPLPLFWLPFFCLSVCEQHTHTPV